MASVKMRDAGSHAGVRISVCNLLLPGYRRIGDIESGPIFNSPHVLALQQGDAQAPQVGTSTAISYISFAAITNVHPLVCGFTSIQYLLLKRVAQAVKDPSQLIISDYILLSNQFFLRKSCTSAVC